MKEHPQQNTETPTGVAVRLSARLGHSNNLERMKCDHCI